MHILLKDLERNFRPKQSITTEAYHNGKLDTNYGNLKKKKKYAVFFFCYNFDFVLSNLN